MGLCADAHCAPPLLPRKQVTVARHSPATVRYVRRSPAQYYTPGPFHEYPEVQGGSARTPAAERPRERDGMAARVFLRARALTSGHTTRAADALWQRTLCGA